MTKLLYIANLRLPTEKAYGIQIAKMCEAFAVAGADVTLIYPFRGNDIKEDLFSYYSVRKYFKIKQLWAPDFYFHGKLDKFSVNIKNYMSSLILCLYVLTHKADIIYSRDEWPLYLLSFFRKNIYFEAHKFSDARKLFYHKFLIGGTKIIAISENLKNKFINFGFLSDNILVAHDGVDLKEFDIPISKEEARNITKLPVDSKIVMYTGHLFDWKGTGTLLETAKSMTNDQLPITNDKILFVFVGGTEYDINELKKKAEGLKNVLILGARPHKEIPVFLKAADILVLPNTEKDTQSNSPLKLFEYMASGRPIVASDLSAIREILNENNSMLIKPDSPEELVKALKVILDKPDYGQALAKKALEDVQNYTWRKRALSILKLIDR